MLRGKGTSSGIPSVVVRRETWGMVENICLTELSPLPSPNVLITPCHCFSVPNLWTDLGGIWRCSHGARFSVVGGARNGKTRGNNRLECCDSLCEDGGEGFVPSTPGRPKGLERCGIIFCPKWPLACWNCCICGRAAHKREQSAPR